MDGISRIDRVAAYFDVWLDPELFPFPKMKVKVLDRLNDDFLAVTNMHRRNSVSSDQAYLSGLGESVHSAMQDLLNTFVVDAREHRPSRGYTESDFEWSAAEDF